jgi:hypothetical protein
MQGTRIPAALHELWKLCAPLNDPRIVIPLACIVNLPSLKKKVETIKQEVTAK